MFFVQLPQQFKNQDLSATLPAGIVEAKGTKLFFLESRRICNLRRKFVYNQSDKLRAKWSAPKNGKH